MNKNILKWAIFDMGGNVYQMTVMTLSILPAILLTINSESSIDSYLQGNKYLSASLLIINIIVALISPIFGSYIDITKKLKKKIIVLTTLNILFMILISISIFLRSLLFLMTFFILGELSFQMTRVIYVAMVPLLESNENRRGSVLAIGVMFSYIGSFIAIGLSNISKLYFGEFNLNYNQFSIGYIPYLILFGSIVYILTSIPMFSLAIISDSDNKSEKLIFKKYFKKVILENKISLNKFISTRIFQYFIIIVFFMSMYISILFVFIVQIVNIGFGFNNPTEIVSIMIGIAIISAIVSAQLFGKLVDKFGNSLSMGFVIFLFSITYIIGYFINIMDQNMILIYIIGIPLGPAMAGSIITQRKFIIQNSEVNNVGNNIGFLSSISRFFMAFIPTIWTLILFLLIKFQSQNISQAIQTALLIISILGIIPLFIAFQMRLLEK